MKLWLLKPKSTAPDRWHPWYDKAFGFVVRAETAASARANAATDAGDEGRDAWTNEEFSTCEELTCEGEVGVVIRDFAAA